ncbi:hypothetical protein [Psychroserpens damuponensis]|uniref:hypothetical protein n=1 Tax=Psychroserpens damuponensis TaxID=943936 RepID=UPI00126A65DB|nr:hypothetical protein [Psychroserpens damuponensis]
MPSKNTLALLFTGVIELCFLVFGILDILDYFIVKVILFSSFSLLAFYLICIVMKDSEVE